MRTAISLGLIMIAKAINPQLISDKSTEIALCVTILLVADLVAEFRMWKKNNNSKL